MENSNLINSGAAPVVSARSTIRRASFASIGATAARVLTAVTGILMARAVGPSALGAYAAVWALIELSTSLSEIGMVTGLKREAGHSYQELPRLLGNALLVRVAAGIIALGIAFVALPLFAKYAECPLLYPPLALAGLSIVISEPLLAALQIRGEQQTAALFAVGRGVAFLAGTIVLMALGQGVAPMAWMQAAVYLTLTVVLSAVVLARTGLKLNLSRVPSQARGALAFGASEMIYAVYLNIPLLAIAAYCSSDQTGYFAVANRFVALSLAVGLAAHHEAFLPALFRLYKHDRPQYMSICAMSQRVFTAIGVIGASLLFVFAEPLVVLLQGEAYRPAVVVLRVLSWLVMVNFAYFAADAALTASDNMKYKILVQTIATALLAALVYALAPAYFMWGVIAAMFGAAMFLLGTTVLGAYRHNAMVAGGTWGVGIRGAATIAFAVAAVHVFGNHAGLEFILVAPIPWISYVRKERQLL